MTSIKLMLSALALDIAMALAVFDSVSHCGPGPAQQIAMAYVLVVIAVVFAAWIQFSARWL